MADQNTQEPTMEEILASIRRIISEDEPAPAQATAEEAGTTPHGDIHEDILELTERVEEDDDADSDSIFEAEDDEPALETSGDLDIYSRQPEAASATDFDSDFDEVEEDEQPIVSPPTAATASSSFGQLARTVAMPADGRVLEDVVRELLRPLLKDWLDANLQDIVESAVQAEVERISRRRFS